MANIIKSSSGFLYEEKFEGDMSLIWDISPSNNNYVEINSDKVSITPNGDRVELLIPSPSDNGYVFQSDIEFNPASDLDVAGVVMRSITDNYIELEICGDDNISTNAIKVDYSPGGVVSAKYINSNNEWVEAGNTRIYDINKIGFYAEPSCTEKFSIYNLVMYRNNFITINNFTNDRYKILENGVDITNKFRVKKYSNRLILDGSNIKFPMDLEISEYDENNKLTSTYSFTDVYGGDIFEYENDITFIINGDILNKDVYDLGPVDYIKEHSLKIINNEAFDIKNKTLKVEAYTAFNEGYKQVSIYNNETNTYENEINMDLSAGEAKEVKLKIERDRGFVTFDSDYKFKIIFE